MTLKYANTQAFIVSQDNYLVSKWYKFSSYKHAGLFNIQNPVQPAKLPNLMTGVLLQRESNIKCHLTTLNNQTNDNFPQNDS